MVGLLGEHEAHVNASSRGRAQRLEELAVGNKVRGRKPDVLLGAFDGREVHAANRVHGLERKVGVDLDARVPCVGRDPVDALIGAAILVPHIHERLPQLPHGRANFAHVGVAPFTFVGVADVEAAHVADLIIHDEDL